MTRSATVVAALAISGLVLLFALAIATAPARAQQPPPHDDPHTQDATPESTQAARGADLYHFACATCHGATGAGFEEAVLAFPEDHRYCARCHHPQNAAVMPGSQIGLSTMAFSLGSPPPLTDLERFGTAGALYRYVSAAMPRWAPGSLEEREYLDVTSHLLRLNGVLGEDETLTWEELDSRLLE